MKTINVAPYIKELMIFDDKDYCELTSNGEDYSECTRLSQSGHCEFFLNEKGMWQGLEYHEEKKQFKKCPQCKEAYQAAKAIQDEEDPRESLMEEGRKCFTEGKDYKDTPYQNDPWKQLQFQRGYQEAKEVIDKFEELLK